MPQGLSVKKTYILPPDFDCPVDGDIFVGSVLPHPQKPYESLNADLQDDLEPAKVNRTHKDNWHVGEDNTNEIEVGILANLLSSIVGVGGDLSTSFSKSDVVGITVKRLETEFISRPSAAYLEKCLKAANVWQQIVTKKAPSLWIVTGRKLAYGISTEQSVKHGKGIAAQASVNLAAVGAPIEPGLKGGVKNTKASTISFDGSSDIVLAYRVRRIHYDKKTGVSSEEYNKHTSLSRNAKRDAEDEEDTDEDSEDEEITDIEVFGLEGDDFGAAQLGPEAVLDSGIDEDGEECAVVSGIPE